MRTDVSLSCPIADIYSRLAKPFEGSHPVRVYAQSDWVFGGQPWVMKVAASMFDHWKRYHNATGAFDYPYVPYWSSNVFESDWDAGPFQQLTGPSGCQHQNASWNMTGLDRPIDEELQTNLSRAKCETKDAKEIVRLKHILKRRLAVHDDALTRRAKKWRDHWRSLLRFEPSGLNRDSSQPVSRGLELEEVQVAMPDYFHSERNFLLIMLTNGIAMRRLSEFRPALLLDTRTQGVQKLLKTREDRLLFDSMVLDSAGPAQSTSCSRSQASLETDLARRAVAGGVVEIARRFGAPHCVTARASANLSAWQRSNRPAHDAMLERGQQLYILPSANVMYVRNQKAASRYMKWKMARVFNTSDDEMVRSPCLSTSRMPALSVRFSSRPPLLTAQMEKFVPYRDPQLGTSDAPQLRFAASFFTYTMVRDPLATAVDAYLEVSQRLRALGNQSVPRTNESFRRLPCRDSAEATARFVAYLKAASRGERLGTQFFHSFPQALKLDVSLRGSHSNQFDAIGRVEELDESLQQMQALVGMDAGHVPSATDRDRHTKSASACSDIDRDDPELQRVVCELYRVDYECFDYELPRTCTGMY